MLKVLEISISVVFALIVLGAAASAQYILAINYIKFQRAAKVAVFFHVINGGIATIVGPLQFLQRLRNKYPIIHRWNGRFYLLNLILCYGSAIVMLPYAKDGSVGPGLLQGAAFLYMVITYLILGVISATIGFIFIRMKLWKVHREWMVRNYFWNSGIPLGFMLRMIFVKLFHWTSFNNSDQKVGLFWLCLTFNAIVAEVIIQWNWKTNTATSQQERKYPLMGPEETDTYRTLS